MIHLDKISWTIVLLLCATLGLAPYTPEPHVWQKLTWLATGHPFRFVDIFDFVLHGAPWLLLVAKFSRRGRGGA